MEREQIIRMAREADMSFYYTVPTVVTELQRFAALVAANEYEKVARILILNGFSTGRGDTIEHLLDALTRQVAERERECCAKIAWNHEPDENGPIETAIRARGEKP